MKIKWLGSTYKRIINIILILSIMMINIPAALATDAEESELDFSSYADGVYTPTVEMTYFYQSTLTTGSLATYITTRIQTDLIKLEIETIDSVRQYTLTLPISMKASQYKSTHMFGYAYTEYEYNEEMSWSELVDKEDYVDLIGQIASSDDLYAYDTVASGYVYTISMNDISDILYFYMYYSKYYEGLSFQITSLTEYEEEEVDYTAPTVTGLTVSASDTSDYIDGVYYTHSKIYAQMTYSTDYTPVEYTLEYTFEDGTVLEYTTNKEISIINRSSYDTLNASNQALIDYVDENNDAHDLKVTLRVRAKYVVDGEDFWSEPYEASIPIGKAGVNTLKAANTLDLFTYDYTPQLYIVYRKAIPYDSTLSIASVSDDDVSSNIEDALKDKTGKENVSFEAIDVQLLDKDGNLQTEIIPYRGLSRTWEDSLEKRLTFPTIGDMDITAIEVYLYDEETGTLTEQEILANVLYDTVNVKGTTTFVSSLTNAQPSGIYVFTQADYADYASTVSGWLTSAAYLVNNDDKLVKSAYNGAIVNNRANIYGVDDSLYQYVVLQPIDGSYVENVKYYDGSEYCTAEVVECYENGSPKVVYIPLINNSAYTPLTFTVDGEEQSATLAMNFANLGTLASAPSLTAPVVSVTDENGEERTKYVNDATAAIDMSAYTDSGKIYYSVTSDISGTVVEETEYTEPFTLTASGTEAETYTVTAYVKANSENEYDYASSAVTTKTVSFSAQGAYAETVEEPLIGVQYQSGESLADSVFKITITDATDGAAIYYTTDGTDPTAESSLYTEPFTVNGETDGAAMVIKAVAFKEEMNESPTAQKTVEFLTDW